MESFAGEIKARTSTLSQVQQTLEKAGILFLNDESPGVRLRAGSRRPEREPQAEQRDQREKDAGRNSASDGRVEPGSARWALVLF
jgi:hypothetical protein